MTFKDLLENGGGKAYLVAVKNPTTVTEIDCLITTLEDAKERFRSFYYNWLPYDTKYILFRKSNAKNSTLRDGTPRLTSLTNAVTKLHLTERDLQETEYTFCNGVYTLYLSKDEACDYVINKIKEKKKDLNAIIVKVTNFRFNVT